MKPRYDYKEINKKEVSKICYLCRWSDSHLNYGSGIELYRWWCNHHGHHKRRKLMFRVKSLGTCSLFEMKESIE